MLVLWHQLKQRPFLKKLVFQSLKKVSKIMPKFEIIRTFANLIVSPQKAFSLLKVNPFIVYLFFLFLLT